MRSKIRFWHLGISLILLMAMLLQTQSITFAQPLKNNTAHSLASGSFTQDWTNTGLITVNDDWSGVSGIEGFRGDGLTSLTGADPQTLLSSDTPGVLDVNVGQTNPDTFTTGGVTEFELTNPVVALAGSGTADAPYIKLYLNSATCTNINVAYKIRDLDSSIDDAIQQVALHFRAGNSGDFTNVPAAYVADATSGPNLATLETDVSVTLPTLAEDQATLELRIMTTNAVGNDEPVGIDNIVVSATCGTVEVDPKINEFSASTTGTDVEFVEIFGDSDTDYSALTILEIEGDVASPTGTIDEVIPVGTTDSSGFWVVNLASDTLENGSVSLLLVDGFSGSAGDDLDTDNNGILDVTPWTELVDSVAINDGGAGDLFYATTVLGPNYDGISSFAPGGASRIPDGYDTESTTDWVRNDFDLAGIPTFTGTPMVGEAYNTPGAPNQIYVAPPEACSDPFTPIYDIQGSGLASTLDGNEVATEGVVIADFQTGLSGFNIQDLTGDADPLTSDAIFVYSTAQDVNVGDHVRVRGFVDEYNNLTEITSVSQVWVCDTGLSIVDPVVLSLPLTTVDDLEPYEGMLVTFPQNLVISEYYNYGRYGEIVLTSTRHMTPTALYEPGSPEQQQAALDYLLDRITLDDGRSVQNPDPAIHPDGEIFTMDHRFRGGDLVGNVTGVLDQYRAMYRVQPTLDPDYTEVNTRPDDPPVIGGELKVASFNVLNYFTTLDLGPDICGPAENMECRGADDAEEFTRQRAKIIAAISEIDADVVGLMEIENNINDDAVIDLVAGLNDAMGVGTYAYVDTGVIGTDAIKVAMIYKPDSVTLTGDYAILDSTVDSRFLDDKNRPVLAQSFADNRSGNVFTVAVNHLKSKGSSCDDVSDPDLFDGAGNCNLTRTAAAEALVDWLDTDPTMSGSSLMLIIGDLNSYDKEDPIDAILAGADDTLMTDDDYTDLILDFQGDDAYGYVFDGQLGYLDHALANASMEAFITGVNFWHINADEPSLIDYDTTFKLPAQDALYAPDAYRSSDHDPVIIGIQFPYLFYFPVIHR